MGLLRVFHSEKIILGVPAYKNPHERVISPSPLISFLIPFSHELSTNRSAFKVKLYVSPAYKVPSSAKLSVESFFSSGWEKTMPDNFGDSSFAKP